MKIEGDDISAIDVAHQLDILKGNIMLRRDENYLHPDTEKERNILIEEGFDEGEIDDVFQKFYGE